MTAALVNILLAGLAACNAHATQLRTDLPPLDASPEFVSYGSAWEPGFESCAINGPRMVTLLATYFKNARDISDAKQLHDDQVAVMRAAIALGQMSKSHR